MSLYGSIKEVQNTIEKLYLKLEQRFNGNKLIGELWGQMAQDVSRQIHSLHELPRSFWSRLIKDQGGLIETIKTEIKPQSFGFKKDLSLSGCIDKAIQSEEAIILKIYVPLIRNLRKNWTGQALDFYIMVKAHIVRIKRVAEAYSGNPIVMQHSALLFQGFEKEIQEPEIEIIQKIRSARKSRTAKKKKPEKPKAKAKVKTEAKLKPKVRTKTKTKSETKAKPKVKAKTKPRQEAKPKPRVNTRLKTRAATKSRPSPQTKVKKKPASKTKKPQKPSKSPINRSKIRRSRPKPMVEKAEIRRRRARR